MISGLYMVVWVISIRQQICKLLSRHPGSFGGVHASMNFRRRNLDRDYSSAEHWHKLAIAASTVLVDKESCMLYTSFPKDNLSNVCYK